ncbi:MAG: MurR/RpiR family transcriptional regulator, partial [Clostridia bacterium]|nr:MurR/RpiR family transcriptional regulator [Clostridia bacterium]
KNIYILGARSAATAVQFMGYYLNFIMYNVHVITSGVSDIVEQISHIRQGDILVAVSFPRYARRALDGAEYAKKRGADVAVITDSEYSPLVPFADEVLYARSDMTSFVDSLVAPLSLVNALLIAVSSTKKQESMDNFLNLENIWKDYGVYKSKDVEE